jgi:small subunit ribosomal protein S4
VANSLAGRASEVRKYPWLEVNPDKFQGTFISRPKRSQIPEKINEQLIVELYSK